jgi:hypothetical protein
MSIYTGTATAGSTYTSLTIGDLYIEEDTITGRDDLTALNIFIQSKGTSSFISLYNDVYVGGDSDGPFTEIVGGTSTYYGSDFTVYGSYVASDPTTRYGMFWTADGANPNTLTIYGNIKVVGSSAIFVTEETITSDAVITLGAPVDSGVIVPTTKDMGIEFKYNTSAITTYTIIAINVYSPTKSIITTSTATGYLDDEEVVIAGSNSTPSIDGIYNITVINSTQFTISAPVTGVGTSGTVEKTYNTGFFGFDYSTARFKYMFNCDNVNDVYVGSYGDVQVRSVYMEDDGVFFGTNELVNIYLSSGDLIIENNNPNKDIIFKANNGVSTEEIARVDGSAQSLVFSNDIGFTVGATGDLAIYISGTDVVFENTNNNSDFNFIANPAGVPTSSLYLDGTNMFVGVNNTTPVVELDVDGDLCVRNEFIFGDATTNGSWKYVVETGVLNLYKRIGGVWVLKQSLNE